MSTIDIDRFALAGGVAATAVRPRGLAPVPLCLFLYGGGGDEETLVALAPLLESAWATGACPPVAVACAGVPGLCFYLDDEPRGMRHESVVADDLVATARARLPVTEDTGLVGVSMGGYGALKIAFARPRRFRAVAAVAPVIEPSLRADRVPPRNRFFYPPGVPAALLGADRDLALYERDHPARRAIANARALRAAELPIYLDAAGRDALNAHDGAELLHRVLWDLDIAHEYHLVRDADHVGPTVAPRLQRALAWVARRLVSRRAPASEEERSLRASLADARAAAAALDPSVGRVYGLLPGPCTSSGADL